MILEFYTKHASKFVTQSTQSIYRRALSSIPMSQPRTHYHPNYTNTKYIQVASQNRTTYNNNHTNEISKKPNIFSRKHNKYFLSNTQFKRLSSSSSPTLSTVDRILMRSIEQDAAKETRKITFKEMFEYSKVQTKHMKNVDNRTLLIDSAEYIRKEVPSRLAKVILAIQSLPYGIIDTPSVTEVYHLYLQTYKLAQTIPEIKSLEDENDLVRALRFWLKTHLMVIPKMCLGLLEKSLDPDSMFDIESSPYLGDFMDDIASQRLGIRLLLGHQLSLHDSAYYKKSKQNNNNNQNKFHGLFEENCNVLLYIEKAIKDSTNVCSKVFNGIVPNVKIIDKRDTFQLTYVPEHLHHCCFELVKNSMRATIEHCLNRNGYNISQLSNESGSSEIRDKILNIINNNNKWDIKIIIVDSNNGDVTIKVSDKGGGIPRYTMDKIFLYGYTTAYRGEANNLNVHHIDLNEQDTEIINNSGEIISNENSNNNKLHEMTHLMRQKELFSQIIHENEHQLDHDWIDEEYCSVNFADYVKSSRFDNIDRNIMGALTNVPMFGLGYGLPHVRVYSKYFGGSCKIHSVYGHGTDAYIYCPNLSKEESILR